MTTQLSISEKKSQFAKLLDSQKEQIKLALPSHINPDVMIRVALTSISKTPKLLECNQTSLLGAIIQASQLGLMPDSITGQAYLIPFKLKNGGMICQFIPGYRGLVQLAYRSGKVKGIYAEAVYEKDHFKSTKGLNRDLVHEPSDDTDPSKDKPVKFYAVIQYLNGGYDFEVMTKAEVDFVRRKSAGASNAVWDDYYAEMGKKTVLRKLLKMAPLSPEIQTAIGLDEQAELGKAQKNAQILDPSKFDEMFKNEIIEDQEAEIMNEQALAQEDAINKKKETIENKASAAVNATEKALKK